MWSFLSAIAFFIFDWTTVPSSLVLYINSPNAHPSPSLLSKPQHHKPWSGCMRRSLSLHGLKKFLKCVVLGEQYLRTSYGLNLQNNVSCNQPRCSCTLQRSLFSAQALHSISTMCINSMVPSTERTDIATFVHLEKRGPELKAWLERSNPRAFHQESKTFWKVITSSECSCMSRLLGPRSVIACPNNLPFLAALVCCMQQQSLPHCSKT